MNPDDIAKRGHYTPGGGWSTAPDPRVKVAPPTDRQVRQLLDTLMHHIDMDNRRRLMRELPAAYNAYCGWEVVEVHSTTNRRRV